VTDVIKRPLAAWLKDKQMTPEALSHANAGLSPGVIARWQRTGEVPPQALARGLQVADALGVPPELLEFSPDRRGLSEGGYRFVLYTTGENRTGWKAVIESWRPPTDQREARMPRALASRFSDSGARAHGATRESSLDVLETELRALIRESA
jgi:hypothetical protein